MASFKEILQKPITRRGLLGTAGVLVGGAIIYETTKGWKDIAALAQGQRGGEPEEMPQASPSVKPEAKSTIVSKILKVEVPKSLDDPDMKSYPFDQAPKGVWFHPLHQPDKWKAPNWDGTWSWGVSLMNQSEGARLESHGEEGRVIIQVDEGKDKATIVLGAITSEMYKGKKVINDYKWGTRGGPRSQNSDWAIGMWVTTQPGSVIELFDPDTGEALVKDGKKLMIVANDRGNAGIILPDNGRVAAKWTVTDPTRGSFESEVAFGPDDDPQSDQRINKIDVRVIAQKK